MKAPSLSQLRAAALPFVTRSLRGNRLRRYTLLSMMLAALTVMVGTWITLSPGSFERELRHEFGMEDARYERERQEFTIAANWFFAGHNNKLTFDYSYLTLDDSALGEDEGDHRVRLQWDVSF